MEAMFSRSQRIHKKHKKDRQGLDHKISRKAKASFKKQKSKSFYDEANEDMRFYS